MDKILLVMELVRQKLNEYFRSFDSMVEDWVVLSNMVDAEGRAYQEAVGKVVIFLANIQHETSISTFNRNLPTDMNRYAIVTPPVYIDLFLLFYANFSEKNYRDGLAMISGTISFFQENPLFNHATTPDLDPSIDKLSFEITNLDLAELNYLMGLAGVKYLPSVYYKVRMIPFRSDVVKAQVSAVRGTETPGNLDDSPQKTSAPLAPRKLL